MCIFQHIELIATDGKTQKRVLWIDTKRNGVYAGFCREKRDIHMSYHVDGNLCQTMDGKTDKMTTLQPLKEFRYMYQMFATAFPSDLSEMYGVPSYGMKKLDAVIYVDTRAFSKKKKAVGCSVFLLEPRRFDLIDSATNSFIPVTEIHIFIRFKPWILISVYEVEDTRRLARNSDAYTIHKKSF